MPAWSPTSRVPEPPFVDVGLKTPERLPARCTTRPTPRFVQNSKRKTWRTSFDEEARHKTHPGGGSRPARHTPPRALEPAHDQGRALQEPLREYHGRPRVPLAAARAGPGERHNLRRQHALPRRPTPGAGDGPRDCGGDLGPAGAGAGAEGQDQVGRVGRGRVGQAAGKDCGLAARTSTSWGSTSGS